MQKKRREQEKKQILSIFIYVYICECACVKLSVYLKFTGEKKKILEQTRKQQTSQPLDANQLWYFWNIHQKSNKKKGEKFARKSFCIVYLVHCVKIYDFVDHMKNDCLID